MTVGCPRKNLLSRTKGGKHHANKNEVKIRYLNVRNYPITPFFLEELYRHYSRPWRIPTDGIWGRTDGQATVIWKQSREIFCWHSFALTTIRSKKRYEVNEERR